MSELTYLKLRKHFLQYHRKVMDFAMKHPQYEIGRNNYHLLSKEAKETCSILDYMNRLIDLKSDLDKTATFIRRFPIKEYYHENDIDQIDFIKYHFEVFIHKIHTILEVMKLMVNEFYNIGLKEEDCNWKNLKNHEDVKNSAVSKIIQIYYKSFKHLISLRHMNTHRALLKDKLSDALKSDLMIYNESEKYDLEVGEDFKRLRPKIIIDYQVKRLRKERVEYIKNGKEIAENYINRFIYVILIEFFARKMNKDARNVVKISVVED